MFYYSIFNLVLDNHELKFFDMTTLISELIIANIRNASVYL